MLARLRASSPVAGLRGLTRSRKNAVSFDKTQTQVIQGKFSRVLSWYDNEWGFSNRMCDTAIQIAGLV